MTEGGEALGGVAGEGDAAGRIMADLAKVVAAG
jgi:hypothetical protein